MEKIKVDNKPEKTQVLKWETMINFLQKHFQLLWLVKTLFTEGPSYNRITAFKLEYHNLTHSPETKINIWKKCRTWTIDLPKGFSTSKKENSVDQGNEIASSAIPIDQDVYFYIILLFQRQCNCNKTFSRHVIDSL